ncbi:MAG TPA: amino acid adenylation domain-containing protein [Rhodanobacteraceae bacterium]|nr:amino acid adenylation domain-containing protein [Rhodanobacteraceae bacterium]
MNRSTPADLDDVDDLIRTLSSLGVTLGVDGPTLRVSAPKGVIDAALAARITAAKPAILARLSAQSPAIRRVPRDRALPLGFVQQRMWVHNQLEPDTVLYNLPAAWRLNGPLDYDALDRAFNAVIARHEVLRIVMHVDGAEPTQSFVSDRPIGIPREDLSALADEPREAKLRERVHALRDSFIDLEKGPPFVVSLIRMKPDEHVLYFMPHHVVWDGWSFDIFLRDLDRLYRAELAGTKAELPELPIQYADYALWHRRWLDSGESQAQVAHWVGVLGGDLAPLDLPADFPRPRMFTHKGDWEEFTLDAETVLRASHLAAVHRGTAFMVLLAAWYAFLHRISGQRDIVVGAPVQARHAVESTDLIGCFVNTLCLRQQIDPDETFARLIDRVRDTCIAAYEHQDAPVDMLVDALVARRDPSRTPLFQAMFSHQQVARRPRELGGLAVSQVHVNPAATPTDLMFAIMEGSNGARAVLHYSTDIFKPETVRRLRERFEHFLATALADPDVRLADLPVATPQERHTILEIWNATQKPLPDATSALDLVARSVARTPDAPAVRDERAMLTYRELDARSNRLAQLLVRKGAKPGGIVGLHLARSADMVVAMLAVWKAGCAYLPLDPEFPAERLQYMVEDSKTATLISHSDLEGSRPQTDATVIELDAVASTLDAEPDAAPDVGPRDLSARAYVLYTSGSTGRPKGVEIAHRGLVNFLSSMATAPGIVAGDSLLAVTTLSFDISILELMLPLTVGAQLYVATRDDVLDGYALRELIQKHGITVLQATPATWRLLIDSEWPGTPRLMALCGGEALPPALARELLPRVAELWNMYGPTETTIWSTCCRITDADAITVGRPIANTRCVIVDERGTLLPPGIPGELCIGGAGVAIGYLGQPELTAQRFVPDPFASEPGARMYRTGDWARFLDDGRIEFQRRRDSQVKVRGFRIELGEIETQLAKHDAVARAVTLVREDRPGDARIVAYVVLKPGASATGSEFRRFLRRTLPDYMLPQLFVELPELPLTANGKVDRNALPAPAGDNAERQHIAPRSELESLIAGIWREMLGVETISVTDNFFELGGQSLQAAQLVTRVFKQSGHRISPRAVIFETLEQLATVR